MAIQQPVLNDLQNNPDHSHMHRVFANDPNSPAKAVIVDASGNTIIGDGGVTNYAQFDSSGNLTFTGSAGIAIPHMQQSDSTDQAIANITLAQVITFDGDDHHFNITRTSSSRFTAVVAGSYLICFSGVASGVINKRIEFWLRVNGSDVPGSNTGYVFKSTGANAVIAVSFIQYLAAGHYFEFWTWGDDTGCKWDATAAASNPTRPAIPSIIITANFLGKD